MTAAWLLLASALAVPSMPAAGLGQGGLSAAAAASGRPQECSSGSRRALAKGPSVWEQARIPNLQRYCDLMARAHTQLTSAPDAARRSAEEADKTLPGRAAPQVVLARALLALGDAPEAAKAFTKARSIDPRSVEDPPTMHDLARTLIKTGKRDEALVVYRALVPRVDLLGTTDRRVSVLLEAAHASMTAELPMPADLGKNKGGRPRLDEAIAYLREARQRPATQLSGDVLLSLALVLDRAGDREQSDAALGDAQRTGARLRVGQIDYVAAPEDKSALEALAAEGTDRAAAMKAWEGYLAGPGGKGSWAAAARARLDLLKKGGGAVRKVAAAAALKPGKKPK